MQSLNVERVRSSLKEESQPPSASVSANKTMYRINLAKGWQFVGTDVAQMRPSTNGESD